MPNDPPPPREPIQVAIENLHLAVEAIDKHFLNRLRDKSTPSEGPEDSKKKSSKSILPSYKPTLAHLARFHKLQRLRDGLEKFAEVCSELRSRRADGQMDGQVASFAGQVQSLTAQIRDMWATKKAALDAAYCLQYVKALEFKISELLKLCSRLLECCFDLLKSAKNAGVGRLPINQELVMEIAEGLPEKYTVEAD